MKTKIFLLLTSVLITFSCQTDETLINTSDTDLILNNGFMPGGSGSICDPDYVYPVAHPLDPDFDIQITITVTFDSDLTQEEIHCIRYEYFTQVLATNGAKMCMFQPLDPYVDCWRYLPSKPDQTTGSGVCDDPRMNVSPCHGD